MHFPAVSSRCKTFLIFCYPNFVEPESLIYVKLLVNIGILPFSILFLLKFVSLIMINEIAFMLQCDKGLLLSKIAS